MYRIDLTFDSIVNLLLSIQSRSPSKMMKRKNSSMNMKASVAEKKARFNNRMPSLGPGKPISSPWIIRCIDPRL